MTLERERSRDGATGFADLNQLLVELVRGVREVLGDSFCGAYLQGSFAVGDADEHSDVDFIVVTEDDVTPEQQAELQALHQTLYALPTLWAQHLEGSYIRREVLRRPDPARRPLLYLDNGATEFTLDNHDNTAVVRWSLREHGVVLAGPDPCELVDPITPDELRADVRWALAEWAAWFRSIDSISRRGLAVAVLSHCRILHTLASGTVASKRVAGQWALEELDPEWRSLIVWALDDRPNPWTKVHEPADAATFRRTQAFIGYAARWAASIDTRLRQRSPTTPDRSGGDSFLGMSAWHELVERDHDLQNPTSAEKIWLTGSYMRLGPQTIVLDVACGKAGPALILAQEFGCRIRGVDVSAVFIAAARRRIADAGLEKLISVEIADAAQVSEWPSCDAALCLGAAFVWGQIRDAAAALAQIVGGGGAIAVGEPFWRELGRDADGFVDLPQTVARFEAAGVDLIGLVAASDDDWDRYKSLQWRAAVETGGDEVMESHRSRRDYYLSARRAELGWAIFTGRVR